MNLWIIFLVWFFFCIFPPSKIIFPQYLSENNLVTFLSQTYRQTHTSPLYIDHAQESRDAFLIQPASGRPLRYWQSLCYHRNCWLLIGQGAYGQANFGNEHLYIDNLSSKKWRNNMKNNCEISMVSYHRYHHFTTIIIWNEFHRFFSFTRSSTLIFSHMSGTQ